MPPCGSTGRSPRAAESTASLTLRISRSGSTPIAATMTPATAPIAAIVAATAAGNGERRATPKPTTKMASPGKNVELFGNSLIIFVRKYERIRPELKGSGV